MPSDAKLVQIVITRKSADQFRVATFSKRECVGGREMDRESVEKFVSKTMKQLKALPGIGD